MCPDWGSNLHLFGYVWNDAPTNSATLARAISFYFWPQNMLVNLNIQWYITTNANKTIVNISTYH